MNTRPQPFDPRELREDGQTPDDAVIAAMARELAEMASEPAPAPPATFGLRVKSAIAHEPNPVPARNARIALGRADFGGLVAAVRDARRVAFGVGRPFAVRAQAAALLLAALLLVATVGTAGAVGAVNLLAPRPAVPETTHIATPSQEPPDSAETESQESSAEPSETAEAQESGSGEQAGPSESESPGGSGNPDGTKSPEPSRTPKPTSSGGSGGSGGHGGG